jgi:hypothetical protein
LSLGYGALLSMVSLGVVFATLFAISLMSVLALKILGKEEKEEDDSTMMKAAIMAAVYSCIDGKVRASPNCVQQSGRTNWSTAARIEALDTGMRDEN